MSGARIETLDHVAEGLAVLAARDPRLAAIIAAAGDVPLRRRAPGFGGLAAIVVAQMVSRASANAIWARLCAIAAPLTPAALLALDEDDFRSIGLSRAKQATLQRAASACAEGRLDLDRLGQLPPDAAIGELTAIKGIGPWTAEVYLLFCAGHGDVFPAGDIALQSAARHGLKLDRRPDARALRAIAEDWQPWRGVAARLLWAYYARAVKREVLPLQA